MVGALRWVGGKLYSGGKDGMVKVWNTGNPSSPEKTFSFDGILIRAIDVMGSKAVVGLRDGTIYELDLSSGSKKMIMESHSDGEVWGISVINNDIVVTSGDDNKLKTWSISKRQCIARGTIHTQARKVKRGGASTLSTFPDS